MFYEGTEKRLEISIKQNNLLQFPEIFWQEMVAQADAFILSKIENKTLRAYLLSESSLFIWKNKLLLITCGNTNLVKAAQFFQKKLTREKILSLLFHRHQAIRPELQETDFAQDCALLSTHLQGKTMHWREEYKGDLFLSGNTAKANSHCKQILMLHGLSGPFAEKLQAGTASTEQIESTLALTDFFPALCLDQYTFTPKGYSLNAIAGNNYLTIHITPEKLSNYLSLESSFAEQVMQPFIKHLMRLFTPSQSHLINFNEDMSNALEITVQPIKALTKTPPAHDH